MEEMLDSLDEVLDEEEEDSSSASDSSVSASSDGVVVWSVGRVGPLIGLWWVLVLLVGRRLGFWVVNSSQ